MNYLNEMRNKFSENITKGKILDFDDLINSPLDEDEKEFIPYLKDWYDTIINSSFLPKIENGMEEIFIHNSNNFVIKTKNTKQIFDSVINQYDLNIFFELLTLRRGIDWNFQEPFASFKYKFQGFNTRVTLIHHSMTSTGSSKMFIRILNKDIIPIQNYSHNLLLKDIINKKKNILIAGATGSGKTTFVNSLLNLTKTDEHIIIIEDTEELIEPNNKTTKLLTDPKVPKKTMNNYLSYSKRMSPDRIILGEIRSKEAETSLLAMNTGHNGFITTIHANSAHDAINRLALLFKIHSNKELSYSLILKLIASNINYVIYLEDKKIKEIIEVYGSNEENLFFESISDSNSL